MDKKLAETINQQISFEFLSGYLYLQMAAWCEEKSLKGFANWLRIQSQEEACHGMIMFNYLVERGAPVSMGPIAAPRNNFKNVQEIFEATLEHERMVTSRINDIVDLAETTKDRATRIAFDWFINEQVEEEANASEILEKLKMLGPQPGPSLLMLDAVLAQRTFAMPAPLAAKNT